MRMWEREGAGGREEEEETEREKRVGTFLIWDEGYCTFLCVSDCLLVFVYVDMNAHLVAYLPA